jgi:uncharacterized membrane protein YgdD (TMEM256/DUF423 family)
MSGATWIRIGALLGAAAVAAGAFGAHGLKERLDARSLKVFETAAQYQMYHALALLAVGLLALPGRPGPALTLAGWSFLVGILIFSGTLYGLSISEIKWLGAITPIGGLALILGWIALAVAAGGSARASGGEL